MSKTLKVLKEKYEGKSFSVIIGNWIKGGGGGCWNTAVLSVGEGVAREQALQLGEPREVTREQHAKRDTRAPFTRAFSRD